MLIFMVRSFRRAVGVATADVADDMGVAGKGAVAAPEDMRRAPMHGAPDFFFPTRRYLDSDVLVAIPVPELERAHVGPLENYRFRHRVVAPLLLLSGSPW
jgi:hypothetical protein